MVPVVGLMGDGEEESEWRDLLRRAGVDEDISSLEHAKRYMEKFFK